MYTLIPLTFNVAFYCHIRATCYVLCITNYVFNTQSLNRDRSTSAFHLLLCYLLFLNGNDKTCCCCLQLLNVTLYPRSTCGRTPYAGLNKKVSITQWDKEWVLLRHPYFCFPNRNRSKAVCPQYGHITMCMLSTDKLFLIIQIQSLSI